ncbi:MAG: hypothetical protein E7525_01755 [Ruminococcaceae bacterium]|nr:hypothetical protein [Oscillospiraceae bacterium]
MLKKLFKYDFNSVFKYWWIAALSSFILSVIGGGCLSLMTYERDLPTFFYTSVSNTLGLVVIGFVVFVFLSCILVYVRFYKNFFSDEGYLTFTLPVKRSELLNSKLLLGVATTVLTAIVFIADLLILFSIPFPEQVEEIFESFFEMLSQLTVKETLYFVTYTIEFIIICLLSVLLSTQFVFGCITISSIIAKKARVLIAIGIYYGTGCVTTFVTQMFFIFGVPSVSEWLVSLQTRLFEISVALVMLAVIAFLALICALLYAFEYWMLDRKLNLS